MTAISIFALFYRLPEKQSNALASNWPKEGSKTVEYKPYAFYKCQANTFFTLSCRRWIDPPLLQISACRVVKESVQLRARQKFGRFGRIRLDFKYKSSVNSSLGRDKLGFHSTGIQSVINKISNLRSFHFYTKGISIIVIPGMRCIRVIAYFFN